MRVLSDGSCSGDWKIKDAILSTLVRLHSRLIDSAEISASSYIEFLTTHTLPELQSENPFLRTRACQVYEQVFLYQKVLVRRVGQDHLMRAIDEVYKTFSTSSNSIVLKYVAGLAFSKALQIHSLKTFILPNLQTILSVYLQVMQEVEHEALVQALEDIIIHFHKEIHPFALELAQRMSHYCLQAVQQNGSGAGDQD